MTEKEKDIISYALEGKSNFEIAELVKTYDYHQVSSFISSLNNPENEHYNSKLYQDILMARSLDHYQIIDKDLLFDVVKLIMNGFSNAEIEIMLNLNRSVRDIIEPLHLKNSGIYDLDLYQKVIKKMNETLAKKEDEILKRLENLERQGMDLKSAISGNILRTYERKKKIRNVLFTYLDYNQNISIEALAKECNVPVHYVRSVLTGSYDIQYCNELVGQEKMTEIVQNYLKNSANNKVSFEFPTILTKEEKNIIDQVKKHSLFWRQIVLTFRLSLEDFAWLVQFPMEKIEELKKAIYFNSNVRICNALNYLFTYYTSEHQPEQQERRKNVKLFLQKLSYYQKTNPLEHQKCIQELNDEAYRKIVNEKEKKDLTEEDYRVIFTYILKYALSTRQYPYDFRIKEHCPKDMENDYENLLFFNQQTSHQMYKGSSRK